MPEYNCYRCGYKTHIRTHIVNHLNKKKICYDKIRDINLDDYSKYILKGLKFDDIVDHTESYQNHTESYQSIPNHTISSQIIPNHTNPTKNIKEYQCLYCNHIYKHNFTLTRHLKTCKEYKKELDKQNLINELREKIETQDEKIEMQQKEIKELKSIGSKTINSHNRNTINNNNNTFNVNINRLDYEKTNYNKFTDREMERAISMTNQCVQEMFRITHFNKKYPQNQNLYASCLKSGMIMIMENGKWNAKPWKRIADKIIHDNSFTMYAWLTSNKEQHPGLFKKYNTYEQNSQKKGFKKNQRQDLLTSMYNNRSMVFSDETVNNLHRITQEDEENQEEET